VAVRRVHDQKLVNPAFQDTNGKQLILNGEIVTIASLFKPELAL
jgi:hypothetical protein